MHVWILLGGMFLIGVLGLAYGVLMLVSPSRWSDLIDQVSFADRWSSRVGSRSRGTDIQIRIVGLIMAVGGFFFSYTAFRGLAAMVLSKHLTYPTAVPVSAAGGSHTWFDLAVPAAASLLGIYLLLFPDPFLRWMARKLPSRREFKHGALPYVRALVRVMGGIALYAGLSGVYTWVRAVL